jgi:hypothetical protein
MKIITCILLICFCATIAPATEKTVKLQFFGDAGVKAEFQGRSVLLFTAESKSNSYLLDCTGFKEECGLLYAEATTVGTKTTLPGKNDEFMSFGGFMVKILAEVEK